MWQHPYLSVFGGKIRSITRAKHYHLQLAAVHRALLRDRPFRSLLQSHPAPETRKKSIKPTKLTLKRFLKHVIPHSQTRLNIKLAARMKKVTVGTFHFSSATSEGVKICLFQCISH